MLAGRPASAPLGQSSLRELDSFPAVVSGAFSVALSHHRSGPWGSQCCLAQMLPGSTDLGWTFQQSPWGYPSPSEVTGWGDEPRSCRLPSAFAGSVPEARGVCGGPGVHRGDTWHHGAQAGALPSTAPLPRHPTLALFLVLHFCGDQLWGLRQEPPQGSGTPEHFHFFTRRRVSLLG